MKRSFREMSSSHATPFDQTAAAEHWAFDGSRVMPDRLGLELRRYKHKQYNTGVVLGNVPGPICSVVMVFATAEEGDKGRTHCLEHMCFMESKSFPRGVLDLLATRCGSNGTNASTDSDNTQYEFEVVGTEGLHKVLPVFINHTLAPKLSQQAFLTEVFHINGKGARQGTVYSEMIGRTNSESDLMWNNFLQTTYGKKTAYGNNCGGLPDDIATLSVKELRHYHNEVYTTDNLDVVITGQFNDADLLNTLHTSLSRAVEQDGAKITCLERPFSAPLPPPPSIPSVDFDVLKKGGQFGPTRKVVMFPSEDESVGSFMYGAKLLEGDLADTVAMTASDVVLRFVAGLSSAPLNQTFVEIPDPLASSISCDTSPSCQPYFYFEFAGVPYLAEDEDEAEGAKPEEEGEEEEEEGEVESNEAEEQEASDVSPLFLEKDKMLDTFLAVMEQVVSEVRGSGPDPIANEAAWTALKKALKKERVSLKEDFEDSPHQDIAGSLIPEFIFKHYPRASGRIGLGDVMDQSKDMNELATKERSWWADFIEEMVVKKLKLCKAGEEGGMTEIRTVPSEDLAQRNDAKAERITKENKKRLGAQTLRKLQSAVDEAEVYNKVVLSDEVKAKFPSGINLGDVGDIERTVTHHPKANLEVVEVDIATSFVSAIIYWDIGHLPAEVRRHVYLFSELLMESDANGMSFKEVVKKMDDELVSYCCSTGRFSQFMSLGIQPNTVSFYLVAEPTEVEKIGEWVDTLLHTVQFTAERVATQSKNMLSDVSENVRDAGSVLDHVMKFAMFKPHSQHCLTNPFSQKNFLKRCVKNPESAVSGLNAILHSMSSEEGVRASCIVAASDATVRSKAISGITSALMKTRTAPLTPLYSTIKWGEGAEDERTQDRRSFVVAVGGVDTAAVALDVTIDEEMTTKEIWALRYLCQCISMGEGDLTLAVRGKGLAYGAGVYFNQYQKTISLDIWECTNVGAALESSLAMLRAIGEEGEEEDGGSTVLTDFNIQNACGSIVFKLKNKRGTPAGVVDSTSSSCMRGLFSPEEERVEDLMLHDVTKEEMRAVYTKYVSRLLGHPSLLAGVATSPKQVDAVAKVWLFLQLLGLNEMEKR